jgi:hypothetical protein
MLEEKSFVSSSGDRCRPFCSQTLYWPGYHITKKLCKTFVHLLTGSSSSNDSAEGKGSLAVELCLGWFLREADVQE